MAASRSQDTDGGKVVALPPARDAVADLLKGTAVVLMIQVHLMELFAQPAALDSCAGEVSLLLGGPPAAPLFMLVMGYYTAASRRSMGGLLLRGIKLLALAVLLNLGLNAHLFVRIAQGVLPLDPWPFVLGVDILFVAAAGTMLLAVLRPLLRRWLLAPLAAALLVAAISPWMTQVFTTSGPARWVFAYVAGDYKWSYFPWFPWLAYPLLGFACHQWQSWLAVPGVFNVSGTRSVPLRAAHRPCNKHGARCRIHCWRWLEAGAAIACAATTAATWKFGVAVCHDLPRYYHHGVAFFLWTCAFLVAWLSMHRLGEKWFGGATPLRWLKQIGRNVTLCYVVQWLLIGNITTALYKSQTLMQWAVWVVAIVTATALLARLLLFAHPKAWLRRNNR